MTLTMTLNDYDGWAEFQTCVASRHRGLLIIHQYSSFCEESTFLLPFFRWTKIVITVEIIFHFSQFCMRLSYLVEGICEIGLNCI